MKLSSGYRYIVLCEDSQMKSFIISFLLSHGISSRKVTCRNYPCGKGCGEAFVKKEYPKEVRVMLSKNYLRTVLVVCSDADSLSVDDRVESLDEAVKCLTLYDFCKV